MEFMLVPCFFVPCYLWPVWCQGPKAGEVGTQKKADKKPEEAAGEKAQASEQGSSGGQPCHGIHQNESEWWAPGVVLKAFPHHFPVAFNPFQVLMEDYQEEPQREEEQPQRVPGTQGETKGKSTSMGKSGSASKPKQMAHKRATGVSIACQTDAQQEQLGSEATGKRRLGASTEGIQAEASTTTQPGLAGSLAGEPEKYQLWSDDDQDSVQEDGQIPSASTCLDERVQQQVERHGTAPSDVVPGLISYEIYVLQNDLALDYEDSWHQWDQAMLQVRIDLVASRLVSQLPVASRCVRIRTARRRLNSLDDTGKRCSPSRALE
ncbi:unnamed protein product [Polarella glacialis]|uniref:Uncharacterized protein n=1 Tax=Polarella glacialis TaxID=89957 RepID=A0A813J549_POLGL|nr:unnamed protein product [Polarella glacialis]